MLGTLSVSLATVTQVGGLTKGLRTAQALPYKKCNKQTVNSSKKRTRVAKKCILNKKSDRGVPVAKLFDKLKITPLREGYR